MSIFVDYTRNELYIFNGDLNILLRNTDIMLVTELYAIDVINVIHVIKLSISLYSVCCLQPSNTVIAHSKQT